MLCTTTLAQDLVPAPLASLEDFVPVSPTPRKLAVTVSPSDRTDVVRFFNEVYKTSQGVATEWSGDRSACLAGTTGQAYLDATVLRVNFFRAMAGLPADVTLSNTWNVKAQEAALMLSVKGELNHFPDPTWPCFTSGGAEAAGRSNITLGAHGAEAIDLYMDDPGANNIAVGHRRWILYPPTKLMGVGNIPGSGGQAANDLWVIGGAGSRPTQPEWVAWPPAGYLPYQLLPQRSGRWSFSYPQADFSNARVSMQHEGASIPLATYAPWPGYGDHTIVWVPEAISAGRPAADKTYNVLVSDVIAGGQTRSFSYFVTIIDPDAPVLGITTNPSGTLELSWSTAYPGYSLEYAASIGPSGTWEPAGSHVEVVGNWNVVQVQPSAGVRFFRLRRP